jgi:succinoglycan biosynthesis protein ExoH
MTIQSIPVNLAEQTKDDSATAMQRRLDGIELSRSIGFARITLIVGLVFLHYGKYPNSTLSPFRGMDVTTHQVATFINSFILFFFFAVVPLLSVISGWLFFAFSGNSLQPLGRRIRKRVVSLYLPLVSWNAFFLAILLLIYLCDSSYPLLQEINIKFETAKWPEYINAIFGLTQHPVGFQFWFVRDLFVTALISPLLWLGLTRAPYIVCLVLGAAWITNFELWIFFRSDVVFFFYLGGLIRQKRWALSVSSRFTLLACAVYVAIIALRVVAPYVIDVSIPLDRTLLDTATRAGRLIGVSACWGVLQHAAQSKFGAWAASYGGLAFFLHGAHFPLLAEVKILLWNMLPAETDAWMLVHYLASVAITVFIGISLGLLLAKAAPRAFALLNGGRLLGHQP